MFSPTGYWAIYETTPGEEDWYFAPIVSFNDSGDAMICSPDTGKLIPAASSETATAVCGWEKATLFGVLPTHRLTEDDYIIARQA